MKSRCISVLFFFFLGYSAAQVNQRAGDWIDIQMRLKVNSGSIGAVAWGMSVPKAIPEPTIRPIGTLVQLQCKQKQAQCKLTGLFPAGFDGPIAVYRYTMPQAPSGTIYTIKANPGTISRYGVDSQPRTNSRSPSNLVILCTAEYGPTSRFPNNLMATEYGSGVVREFIWNEDGKRVGS
jgi:hypothetical protein